ncbi:MAG: carbonic anhydrase [Alphaproteobacteria bacterium]|nr:carbonic anhydrase [Alphaproteobacteria bacterium]
MDSWKRLLLENKAWAQDKASHTAEDRPGADKPEFLWIGCSDARVPAERLTGASSGELFVHRNVANLVVHTDVNLLAVLECAVGHIGVEHVVVCGHYECLGIRAAQSRETHGMMDAWLNHVKDTWRAHKDELDLHDEAAAHRRLVELNVMQQVRNLARTTVVQRAWKSAKRPTLHGWVYDPHDFLIRPLVRVDADTPLDAVHQLTSLD